MFTGRLFHRNPYLDNEILRTSQCAYVYTHLRTGLLLDNRCRALKRRDVAQTLYQHNKMDISCVCVSVCPLMADQRDSNRLLRIQTNL